MRKKGSSTTESLSSVLQPQIGLYQNSFKNVLNVTNFCYIAAPVTNDSVIFLEAVDGLILATTFESSSLTVHA